MTIQNSKLKNFGKGFVLLLAVLITSIVFGISFGFSAFIIRELRVSAIGRESQKAVFASDSGVECVLYWEFVHGGLPQSAFATNTGPGYPANQIYCADRQLSCTDVPSPCSVSSFSAGGGGDSGGVSSFTLNFSNGSCTNIIVDKVASYPNVRIESKGYNTCASGVRDKIERAFRVIY